jgi:hypothetical protein
MRLSANPSARTALTYISVGGLLIVTAAVWYLYTRGNPEAVQGRTWGYVQLWMFLIGSGAILLGLMVGRIGREAKRADAPPAPAGADAQVRPGNAAAAPTAGGTPGTPVYIVTPPTPARR